VYRKAAVATGLVETALRERSITIHYGRTQIGRKPAVIAAWCAICVLLSAANIASVQPIFKVFQGARPEVDKIIKQALAAALYYTVSIEAGQPQKNHTHVQCTRCLPGAKGLRRRLKRLLAPATNPFRFAHIVVKSSRE
jgi:hypothetical protein